MRNKSQSPYWRIDRFKLEIPWKHEGNSKEWGQESENQTVHILAVRINLVGTKRTNKDSRLILDTSLCFVSENCLKFTIVHKHTKDPKPF